MFDPSLLLGIPAVVKIVDAYRQAVVHRDWKRTATTIGAWVTGTGIVYLIHFSTFDFTVGNPADAVLLGIGVGAAGSLTHDGLQALGFRRAATEEGHADYLPSIVINAGEGSVSRADDTPAH